MTYVAAGVFRRTAAQRRDQRLAWERSDQAFFAAGACHILAWAFCTTYPNAGFEVVAIRRPGEPYACHVYVSDGAWAFDHAGWTPEAELLRETERFEACRMQRLVIRTDLTTYCQEHHGRLPEQYWADPWPRACRYLASFPAPAQQGYGK